MLETDASIDGIGAVLGQYQDDENLHPVSYASRALSRSERNYGITELETLAVVWAISHFCHFLFEKLVTVFTDHTAVKAVLETPNPSGKHACWWNKVYGCGVREVRIIYRAGKENKNTDALSRSPVSPAPQTDTAAGEVQVASVYVPPEDSLGSNAGPQFCGDSELVDKDEVLGIDLQSLFECSDGDKEGVTVLRPTSSNSSLQPFDGKHPVECHYITSCDGNSSQKEREENSHGQNSFAMEQRKDRTSGDPRLPGVWNTS